MTMVLGDPGERAIDPKGDSMGRLKKTTGLRLKIAIDFKDARPLKSAKVFSIHFESEIPRIFFHDMRILKSLVLSSQRLWQTRICHPKIRIMS